MTGRLTQSQQRLEDVHARLAEAVALHTIDQARGVLTPQLLVERALLGLEFDLDRLLDAGRQLLRHHGLRAPQHHRTQRARQQLLRRHTRARRHAGTQRR